MLHKLDLSGLGNDLLINTSSYLDYNDVLNLAFSNKSSLFLLNDELVWKNQISNYIPTNLVTFDEDFPGKSYKDKFIFIIGTYSRFRTYISNLIQKVDNDFKAQEFLKKNFFYDYEARKEIDTTVSTYYEKIPLDYYILFRLLNGQKVLGQRFTKDIALFGSFSYYDFFFQFFMLPLSKPENIPLLTKYKFHTLTICRASGARLFVDFHNTLKKGYGAIFLLRDQRQEYGKKLLRAFIFKPSLSKLLEDLQRAQYNSEEESIDLFDSLICPSSDVTTNGIRVRTSVILSPWDKRQGFLFTYQIRVSPNGVKGHWKLTQRHWIINDNGQQHEVKGPGVIGMYPEVFEGCPEFTYQSCTPMEKFNGTMGGFLYFENLSSGEEIAVKVGDMKMQIPEGSSWIDFCPEDGEVKEITEF